ncbi:MAG: sarcosine oxidase subunit delta [Alphaproteobacteria bacterium]
MLLITCPWCGPRDGSEFSHGGEAHIRRPDAASEPDDGQWADYLFMRSNPKGVHLERWCHSHGCGKWFHAARNTATDEFLAFYGMDAARPEVAALARTARLPATPSGEPALGSGNRPLAPPGDGEDGP